MKKSRIFIIVLVFALYLTVIQQMPIVNENSYNGIRMILYFLVSLLFVISLSKFNKYLIIPFFKIFLVCLLVSLLILTFLTVMDYDVNVFELLVPFGILVASMYKYVDDKNILKIIMGYIFLASLMSILNILYYNSGFEISSSYLIPRKNQIGPIISLSLVIMLVFILFKSNLNYLYNTIKFQKTFLIISIIFSIILFTTLLVIRNRASILALFLIIILALIIKYSEGLSIKSILSIILFLILGIILTLLDYIDPVINLVWEAMTLNFDTNNIDSFSSGRTQIYIESINFILHYPFFGEIFSLNGVNDTPHNYILNKLVNFGTIFSFPFLLMYLYLWFFAITGLIKSKGKYFIHWLLLFSLIISMFEYTYPFGPGVSQFLLWFLMGQYLNRKYLKDK